MDEKRRRNDNSHSLCGMPDQPADAAHVEPGILPLVEALNRFGLRTRASCQGHWHWILGASDPYVAFTGSVDMALKLSQGLTELWQRGGLHWDLQAGFGADSLLWYRLSPPFRHRNELAWLPPPVWRHRWVAYLRQVERDQTAISVLLERAGQPCSQLADALA